MNRYKYKIVAEIVRSDVGHSSSGLQNSKKIFNDSQHDSRFRVDVIAELNQARSIYQFFDFCGKYKITVIATADIEKGVGFHKIGFSIPNILSDDLLLIDSLQNRFELLMEIHLLKVIAEAKDALGLVRQQIRYAQTPESIAKQTLAIMRGFLFSAFPSIDTEGVLQLETSANDIQGGFYVKTEGSDNINRYMRIWDARMRKSRFDRRREISVDMDMFYILGLLSGDINDFDTSIKVLSDPSGVQNRNVGLILDMQRSQQHAVESQYASDRKPG